MSCRVEGMDARADRRIRKYYQGGRVWAVDPTCRVKGCAHGPAIHTLVETHRPPYGYEWGRCAARDCPCLGYLPGASDLGPASFATLDDDVILGHYGGRVYEAEILPGSTFRWPPRRDGRLVKCAAVLVTAWRVYKALRGRR
jgi:hypothetical protein